MVTYKLTLSRFNERVYRVLKASAEHAGNLQYSNGQWKFKSVGYDPNGEILPGWGPLTDWHNTVVTAPDEQLLNELLSAPCLQKLL
jgi:hypothetical protein